MTESSTSEMSLESMENSPIENLEITLDDSFHVRMKESFKGEEANKSTLGTLQIEESSLSFPAALCDDKLLEEINAIPNKMGYKIGEVAELLNVKQYVLRYWETEFDILKPKKAQNNQRYYTRKDVENAFIIRKLLHRDRFSIEGARAALKDLRSFVKSEVRKDKEFSNITHRLENVQDSLDDLLMDIRRLKMYFSNC